MTALDQFPAEMVGPTVELTAALDDLRSGKPFATLLIDGSSTRAAALESLLDQVTAEGTRIVWVGNPLRSPLTLERLFLQTGLRRGGPAVRTPPGGTHPHMLARTGGDAKRALLIVQQPDTLDVAARETLGRMAAYFADGEPVCRSCFAVLLVPRARGGSRRPLLCPRSFPDSRATRAPALEPRSYAAPAASVAGRPSERRSRRCS